MEQYIPKSALVAEIKRRIDYNTLSYKKDKRPQFSKLGKIMEDEALLSVIDTLEVKEVDLEEAARNYLLNEHLSPLNELMHKADLKAEMQYHKDIENAYKAGFNFALKAQKGE